jgi:formate dehydrogenase accessory protein FdhE
LGKTNLWDKRIRRASELVSTYPFAAEGLRFYAQLAMLQQKLGSELEQSADRFFAADGSSWKRLNPSTILPTFSAFLENIKRISPAPLAAGASDLLQRDSTTRLRLIEDFWRSPATAADEQEPHDSGLAASHLIWLFLQPFAESLAAQHEQAFSSESAKQCPLCSGAPIVGVLRPEGDGAKKSLICMLCAHEWASRRIYCPSCGEERESHMAFYSAPEIPHIRVDVCDTCRTYTKSVDLTKNGLAVPVVDELAALPLDLWARENGYQKLQINVVGI